MNPDEAQAQGFDVVLVLPDGERRIRAFGDTHIWDAAFAAGIELPALCHQGYCLTCAGKIETNNPGNESVETEVNQGVRLVHFRLNNPGNESVETEVDQSDSLVYFPQDRQAGYVLLCTAKPRSSL